MKHVKNILEVKGNTVHSISPDDIVLDALKKMAEKDVGALLVTDNEKVYGIMSERDYARKIVLAGKLSKDVKVKEIMTPKVIYVNPNSSTEECMALMVQKRVRHLPVLDNEKLVGLISIGDVVNAIIDEKEFVIDQLVHYITGTS